MAKRMQRRWLSQLRTKDIRLRMRGFRLQSDKTLGVLSGHPDFLSYMESFSGPGPTPYQVQAIVFAETGSIVEKLNAFKQVDDWRAVDRGARRCLVEPSGFLRHFLACSPRFLVLSGLSNSVSSTDSSVWESPGESAPDRLGSRLGFTGGIFEALIGRADSGPRGNGTT